jgi:hypothetical protein
MGSVTRSFALDRSTRTPFKFSALHSTALGINSPLPAALAAAWRAEHTREALASRLIATALGGERDIDRLRDGALAHVATMIVEPTKSPTAVRPRAPDSGGTRFAPPTQAMRAPLRATRACRFRGSRHRPSFGSVPRAICTCQDHRSCQGN